MKLCAEPALQEAEFRAGDQAISALGSEPRLRNREGPDMTISADRALRVRDAARVALDRVKSWHTVDRGAMKWKAGFGSLLLNYETPRRCAGCYFLEISARGMPDPRIVCRLSWTELDSNVVSILSFDANEEWQTELFAWATYFRSAVQC